MRAIIKELDNLMRIGSEQYNQLQYAYQNVTNENSIMKNKLAQQDDTIQVQLGTINSLESQKKELELNVLQYKHGLMKAQKIQLELTNQKTLKAKTTTDKDAKEAQKKIDDLQMKVEQLTVSKANAEAETARTLKLCDYMQELLKRPSSPNQTNPQNQQFQSNQNRPAKETKCRDFERGSCSHGNSCRFFHSTRQCEEHRKGRCTKQFCLDLHRSVGQAREQGRVEKDCPFWLAGECNFDENVCKK